MGVVLVFRLLIALSIAASAAACSPPAPNALAASDTNAAEASVNAIARSVESPYPKVAGRWTIIHSPQVERDTMLLDTATGRTWQLVNVGGAADNEVLAWQPVVREAATNSN